MNSKNMFWYNRCTYYSAKFNTLIFKMKKLIHFQHNYNDSKNTLTLMNEPLQNKKDKKTKPKKTSS